MFDSIIHTLFDHGSHVTKCGHAYSRIYNPHRLYIFKKFIIQ